MSALHFEPSRWNVRDDLHGYLGRVTWEPGRREDERCRAEAITSEVVDLGHFTDRELAAEALLAHATRKEKESL